MLARTAYLLALLSLALATSFQGRTGSITFDSDNKAQFKAGIDTSAAAFGSYDEAKNHTSNFGVLKIETNDKFSAEQQYYAAGFLEGVLTQPEIFNQYTNLASTEQSIIPAPKNVSDYLSAQDKWIRNQVTNNPSDTYWRQVGLILQQYDGLQAGYRSVQPSGQELDPYAFEILNGCGDLFDIVPATMPNRRQDFMNMTQDELHSYTVKNGHCSALVKLTGDYSQMFMSHSSWYIYQSMTRIMKHYNFKTTDVSAASKVSFSSYPGFLESLDDFYIMDTGLVMLQTTNNVFDQSLYKYVVPETIQAWIRVRVACALATSGQEWSALMSKHNSGTYNNQYMVIDLKLFTPGKPLVPNTLWVSEQIPGDFVYTDQTSQLERGYWPSYNVPFHTEIYNKSGYPAIVEKYGVRESYELAPRAQIFRRDQGTVVDMDSFKAIMRYNDYQHDPYAQGDPMAAICSRGDLMERPDLGGCYDTKVTTYNMALDLKSQVVNGPTTSHGLPPFSWSKYPNTTHVGMPDTFNFDFEEMDPNWD